MGRRLTDGGCLSVSLRRNLESGAREPARGPWVGLLFPLTVNWLVIIYAVLALAAGWAYASLRIQTDYRQTLEMERNRLRGVAATLESSTQAMINDGVGAAAAGANAVMTSRGDLDSASGDERSAALAKMLTGGEYVRSLFLYSAGRFASAGRDGTQTASGVPPPWLQLPRSSLNGATWVGKPTEEPAGSGAMVIPIARHVVTADRDGVWAGALFDFAAFEDLYRRLGRDLRLMGIVATDGTVLAIIPRDTTPALVPGVDVSRNPLFRLAMKQPESGVVEGFGNAMGTAMLYGYQRVHGFDMTLLAGQTLDNVLAPWRDRRRTTMLVTGASSALILLMTGLLSRAIATRRRMKQAEEARSLQAASELMRLQDEERRRIGRDLHDSTGQTLAALELSLSRLIGSPLSAPDRREQLEECARLAHQCSAEIRTASYLLHPPLLDELGLLSALRWLADGFHDRSGIEVRLDLPPAMSRLSRDEELTLFRVAQEALTNVHRHAKSSWAAVRLTEHRDSVVLEVQDGGVGADGTFSLGVGLAGMRERLRQVGGTLGVQTSRTGTIVRASLPMAPEQAKLSA
jgi:signal transduction histidine kinase